MEKLRAQLMAAEEQPTPTVMAFSELANDYLDYAKRRFVPKGYDKKVFVVGGRAFTSVILQRNCHEFIARLPEGVADLSKLALEIPLSTTQARQVAVGQSVTVADSEARGRVTALLPQLSASQSVLARASLVDPQKRLRPGQSVQVAIAGVSAPVGGAPSTQSLVVPATALVWKASQPYVFVETAQGFTPTPVQLIRQNASQAEVSGLAAGSRVAAKGVAALKAQWLGE